MLSFTWDPVKNLTNQRKHGVSFEEAQTSFLDETAMLYKDIDHSDNEDRYILLGLSLTAKVLVVVHCYRKNDSEIRIISARRATKNEIKTYLGE